MDAETLAALKRAAKMLDDEAVSVECASHHEHSRKAAAQMTADAALIRALIERGRNGGERAKVVAYAQAQRQKHFDRARRLSPQTPDHKPSRMGDEMRLVSRAKAAAYDELLAAIASGAHEEEQP